jgi:hypothetical protein
MDDDEKLTLAERLAAPSVMVAVLMEYLASLGVGSLGDAALHLRRSAESLPLPRGAVDQLRSAATLMEGLAARRG